MPINALGQFIITDEMPKRSTKRFYRKASPERIARERTVLKYEGRSNTCPKCFEALSRTGDCAC